MNSDFEPSPAVQSSAKKLGGFISKNVNIVKGKITEKFNKEKMEPSQPFIDYNSEYDVLENIDEEEDNDYIDGNMLDHIEKHAGNALD